MNFSAALPHAFAVDAFLLGTVDHPAVEVLQQHFWAEILAHGQTQAALLIFEQTPCRSAGTEYRARQIALEENVIRQNRAGGLIESGPGQLAIFPVLSLGDFDLSPLDFRNTLESVLLESFRELRIPNLEKHSGLGIEARTGLVCRTAVQIRSNISQFGWYLNVNRDYCFHEEWRSSSLQSAANRRISISDVKSVIVSRFQEAFGIAKVNIYTRHPLLGRTTRIL